MSARVTLRLSTYAAAARAHIAAAQAVADERSHSEVTPLHLLMELCARSATARGAVTAAGVDPDDVLVEGELQLRRQRPQPGGAGEPKQAYLSPQLLELLGRAEGEAARSGGARVDIEQLLLATAQEPAGDVRAVLRACGLSAPTLRAAIETAAGEVAADVTGAQAPTAGAQAPTAAVAGTARTAGRGGAGPDGRDLTRLAADGGLDPVVGRDAELRRLLQVLARRRQHNPLIVGEAGVGRRSIVRALAMRIARGDVPSMLTGKRIVTLEAGQLLAGARLRGEAEERVRDWLAAVHDSAGEVIVYSPDLPALVSDRSVGMAAELLADALRNSGLRLIGVADPAGFKRLQDEQRDLAEQMVRVDVEPPDREATIAILRGLVPRYEAEHGLQITDPALVAAADMARRYLPSVQLPRGAVDLIDEAAARLRVEQQSMPAELDQQERRLQNVELQLLALSDDHDGASTRSREALAEERATLAPLVEAQRTRLSRQRALVERFGALKARIAAAEQEAEALGRSGDLPQQSELRFSRIPALQAEAESVHAELHADTPVLVRDAVTEVDLAAVVAERTGIPVTRMLEEETEKLLGMEGRLGARVIGQPTAIGAISRAIRRGRVGLRDPRKPIGSFLFLGSSGVGKTELAKAVATFLFDDELALTRLDMSEFMEKHTVSRLLGSPPGYVGSEDGGFLTEAVRRRPYSVLLFDEIEKAHPDVFDILLQVLDDGRLTDSRGQLAHFSDTVIIMTSNIGSRLILERGAEDPGLGDAVRERLLNHLRPEFVNRIDEVVVFQPLSRADLDQILTLELRKVQKLLAPQQVTLEVGPDARAALVEQAYEPAFGARPLKRVILQRLMDPLAEALLRGGYGAGDRVRVGLDGETLRFERAASEQGEPTGGEAQ